MGENGAGKSTLIKVLSGAHRPDDGTVEINGQPVVISSPAASRRLGISVIYQEFNLIPALTVRENIFLGQEKAPLVARRREHDRVRELLARLGCDIDPEARCDRLSVAYQQIVEIAKALLLDAKIIVMDEPSAALSGKEVDRLLEIVSDLKSRGLGIIYITHRLEEVFAIADRVTVLRDGENVITEAVEQLDRRQLIEAMVGRPMESEFPRRDHRPGEARLRVTDLSRGKAVRNVSFEVRQGEILALSGLVGAGRTETARLLFGADRRDHGTITLDGKPLRLRTPREAIREGICLLTEDRKAQGLILNQSVRDNFSLPNLARLSWYGWLRGRFEQSQFAQYIDQFQITLRDQLQAAKDLSGGNQQKIVLSKWLERNCEVIIFDEPTRGIDVGAKYEIYLLMNQLAAEGKSIIMISSEMPEVLGMADRILVMHNGQIQGEITDVANTTQADVLELAIGELAIGELAIRTTHKPD